MKIFFRKLHRWLGLLMALQIIAWMASGLYFSLFPIEQIRGEHLTRESGQLDARLFSAMGKPATVTATLDAHFGHPGAPADWTLESVMPVNIGAKMRWRVEGKSESRRFTRLLDGAGNQVLPQLTEQTAELVARDWMLHSVGDAEVEWIESVSAGAEYRADILPVWKVSFSEPESISLYLDPWTGEIISRRTSRWRIFDFLWMLHIMDFSEREDFNHPLLQIAAALGLIIALSGVIFWALTTRLFRRRRIAGRQV